MHTAMITAAANTERITAATREPVGNAVVPFISSCTGVCVGADEVNGTALVPSVTALMYPFVFRRVVRVECEEDIFDNTISGLVFALTIPYKICTPSANKFRRKLAILEVVDTTPLMKIALVAMSNSSAT